HSKFADGHHLRLSRHLAVTRTSFFCITCGIMWMGTHAREDKAGMRFSQIEREFTRSKINARIYNACDPTLKSSPNYIFAVSFETRGINVGMAIEEQAEYPFQTTSYFIKYSLRNLSMSNKFQLTLTKGDTFSYTLIERRCSFQWRVSRESNTLPKLR